MRMGVGAFSLVGAVVVVVGVSMFGDMMNPLSLQTVWHVWGVCCICYAIDLNGRGRR